MRLEGKELCYETFIKLIAYQFSPLPAPKVSTAHPEDLAKTSRNAGGWVLLVGYDTVSFCMHMYATVKACASMSPGSSDKLGPELVLNVTRPTKAGVDPLDLG
jgi:hypothetical protein